METIQKLRRALSLEKLGQYSALTIALFGNLWIWKIYLLNPLAFVAAIFGFIAIHFNNKRLLVVLLIILCFIQLNHTKRTDLFSISNDQKRLQDLRLSAYPPIKPPVAYWLEAKPVSVAVTRLQANFFEAMDINLYFFASHPSERVGVREFEKFPYVLLPPFIIGAIALFNRKKAATAIALLVPIFFITRYGIDTEGSVFALFPVISYAIFLGLKKMLKNSRLPIAFIALYTVVLIQIISYELY